LDDIEIEAMLHEHSGGEENDEADVSREDDVFSKKTGEESRGTNDKVRFYFSHLLFARVNSCVPQLYFPL
jgi:hypothetical protein